MRVVGASNALVRGPYVVEGFFWGGISAILSLILVAPVCYFVSSILTTSSRGSIFPIFLYAHLQLFLYQLLFGVVIGSLSSFWAVRRYLKN